MKITTTNYKRNYIYPGNNEQNKNIENVGQKKKTDHGGRARIAHAPPVGCPLLFTRLMFRDLFSLIILFDSLFFLTFISLGAIFKMSDVEICLSSGLALFGDAKSVLSFYSMFYIER